MAKFQYRMQSILDIKMKMESQAKMEYAIARKLLNEEEDKMEQLCGRKESYEAENRELLQNNLRVRKIIDAQAAVARIEEYIQIQATVIIMAEQELERARQKLTAAMQDSKTHDKLREKAFGEFMQEENAKESKEIDQLTSYRYGRKLAGKS